MNPADSTKSPRVSKPIPERFRVARTTLWFDRFMTGTIVTGGLMVIVAVLGIFFFIFSETLPLFGSASVKEEKKSTLVLPTDAILGMDHSGQWSFLFANGNEIDFVHKATSRVIPVPVSLPDEQKTAAASYIPAQSQLAIATDKGQVGLLNLVFPQHKSSHSPKKRSTEAHGASSLQSPTITLNPFYPLTEKEDGGRVTALSYVDAGEKKIFIALRDVAGAPHVNIMTLVQSPSLIDEGEIVPGERYDLTDQLDGAPVKAIASMSGNGLVILTDKNTILYFEHDEESDQWNKIQTLENTLGAGEKITVMDWIFGEMSLALGGEKGSLKVISLFPQTLPDGSRKRLFGETKSFPALEGSVNLYITSQLNRSFFVASDKEVRLCYATTADIRWQTNNLNFAPVHMAASSEFNTLALQDKTGGLHFYGVSDKFPEAGSKALFGKIWYEGYDHPAWQWQSVGGTDDYEPKISLMPLIFGTVKGTLYALLFAVPVALLAAVYTAHFMAPSVKRVVKPIMEIMASLPSVVLGFFGALYLAPIMEDKVPAFLVMAILIPLVTILLGWFWVSRPIEVRNKFKGGFEYLVMLPVLIAIGWLSWVWLGDTIELPLVNSVRTVMGWFGMPGFEAWSFADLWRNGFGLPYEQRNSLVVGFIMGFAVIPVIFTIAEDSLSNVPPSLISASEALGASRWQIVRTIVLPIAAAGIFSALMIGLGRAVGETMIVLMATGNTPIMEWDIFNGMRTLAANIATELPEAAEHSTHYRVLFLSGLILFIMTFVLNTFAEILRHRLREKYKVV